MLTSFLSRRGAYLPLLRLPFSESRRISMPGASAARSCPCDESTSSRPHSAATADPRPILHPHRSASTSLAPQVCVCSFVGSAHWPSYRSEYGVAWLADLDPEAWVRDRLRCPVRTTAASGHRLNYSNYTNNELLTRVSGGAMWEREQGWLSRRAL